MPIFLAQLSVVHLSTLSHLPFESKDSKNIAVAKTLLHLRQNIDIHRIIGLNTGALGKSSISHAFLGHTQQQALLLVAIDMCKIYEPQKRFQLNSIPGIIKDLSETKPHPEVEHETERLCAKYGHAHTTPVESISSLFTLIASRHSSPLEKMKEVRDKYAAHSQLSYSPDFLPSHDEFERLWDFGADFYRCISLGWLGIHPAMFGRHASRGFFKHLEASVGLSLQFDFHNTKNA